MTNTDTLTTICRHHIWANVQLLEACAKLTPEQLDTTMVGAFGSIKVTLQHIVMSEKSYVTRIKTGKRYDRSQDPAELSLAEMLDSARATGADLMAYVPKVQTEDAVEVDWDGTPRMVPKTILITQALFHAAEHREQIKTMMTQIGVEPPDLQGWEFFDKEYEGY